MCPHGPAATQAPVLRLGRLCRMPQMPRGILRRGASLSCESPQYNRAPVRGDKQKLSWREDEAAGSDSAESVTPGR